jgi:hypothetical protein
LRAMPVMPRAPICQEPYQRHGAEEAADAGHTALLQREQRRELPARLLERRSGRAWERPRPGLPPRRARRSPASARRLRRTAQSRTRRGCRRRRQAGAAIGRLFCTAAVSARTPPSPRLSARMMIATYFTVTTRISDQNTSESTPSTLPAIGLEAVRRAECLLHRVQRARADVAEHHADRADHERQHARRGCRRFGRDIVSGGLAEPVERGKPCSFPWAARMEGGRGAVLKARSVRIYGAFTGPRPERDAEFRYVSDHAGRSRPRARQGRRSRHGRGRAFGGAGGIGGAPSWRLPTSRWCSSPRWLFVATRMSHGRRRVRGVPELPGLQLLLHSRPATRSTSRRARA